MAKPTMDRFVERFSRLFEQGATKVRLVNYVKNWIHLAKTGVSINLSTLNTNITSLLLDNFGLRLHL